VTQVPEEKHRVVIKALNSRRLISHAAEELHAVKACNLEIKIRESPPHVNMEGRNRAEGTAALPNLARLGSDVRSPCVGEERSVCCARAQF
jgi:hypothetical protein